MQNLSVFSKSKTNTTQQCTRSLHVGLHAVLECVGFSIGNHCWVPRRVKPRNQRADVRDYETMFARGCWEKLLMQMAYWVGVYNCTGKTDYDEGVRLWVFTSYLCIERIIPRLDSLLCLLCGSADTNIDTIYTQILGILWKEHVQTTVQPPT